MLLLLFLNYWVTIIAQIFNPIAELVISTATPSKEAKAETETHPVILENNKSSKWLV